VTTCRSRALASLLSAAIAQRAAPLARIPKTAIDGARIAASFLKVVSGATSIIRNYD